jgi:hypothetical protein
VRWRGARLEPIQRMLDAPPLPRSDVDSGHDSHCRDHERVDWSHKRVMTVLVGPRSNARIEDTW